MRNQVKRSATGPIVHIKFLDHVEDGDEAIEFEVFGRVLKKTKQDITIGAWTYVNEPNEPGDGNVKTWTIVNRAITGMRELK